MLRALTTCSFVFSSFSTDNARNISYKSQQPLCALPLTTGLSQRLLRQLIFKVHYHCKYSLQISYSKGCSMRKCKHTQYNQKHHLSLGVCCTMRDFSSKYFSMLALHPHKNCQYNPVLQKRLANIQRVFIP